MLSSASVLFILVAYCLGVPLYCGFVRPLTLALAGFAGLCTFIYPPAGMSSGLALLPVLFWADVPAYYFSGTDVFISAVLTGFYLRLCWQSALVERKSVPEMKHIAGTLGMIAFLAITPGFRYAFVPHWYPLDWPKVLWLSFYNGDQLNPFASIYRGWVYVIGALLFFAVRTSCRVWSFPDWKVWFHAPHLDWKWRIDGKQASEAAPNCRWIYWGVIGSGILVAIFAVVGMSEIQKDVEYYSGWGYYFLFPDKHTYAAFCVLQLGLAAWAAKQHGWRKRVGWSLLLIYCLLLLGSTSRAGIFGGIVVLSLQGFLFVRPQVLLEPFSLSFYHRNWKKLAAVVVAAGLILGLLFVTPFEAPRAARLFAAHFQEQFEDLEFSLQRFHRSRLFLWTVALEMTSDFPVFGIGLGRFYLSSLEYSEKLRIRSFPGEIPVHENAHNYFLQILAETGLVGAAAVLLFILWLFWKRWDVRGASINTSAGIALIGVLMISMLGHPLLVNSFFYSCCGVAGLLADKPSA